MGDKNEAISDDTRVKMYTPAGLMNYSNSRVRGYGLLGDLYLIIDNLNRILLKHTKISVSAMACFLVGSRGSIIVVYWLETVTWTRVRSYLSLVLIVQD